MHQGAHRRVQRWTRSGHDSACKLWGVLIRRNGSLKKSGLKIRRVALVTAYKLWV